MELTLRRRWFSGLSTIGELLVDGKFECFILEDKMREQPGVPVENWKIKHKTAIPVGRYQVVIAPSSRFGREMPRLLNVPGFDGVLIHWGNTSVDTDGCLLTGTTRAADFVGNSWLAFKALYPKLQAIGFSAKIWITITNEPAAGQSERDS